MNTDEQVIAIKCSSRETLHPGIHVDATKRPTDARLDWDLRTLEANQDLQLCHVSQIIPELSLWCVRTRCSNEGQQPSWSADAMSRCTWSTSVWLVGWFIQSGGIHMNARSQGLPAEHCTVKTWSLFFISLVSGFNVLADRFMSYVWDTESTREP